MNFHNSFSTLVWMFIIVKLNVSFVVSTIVPFQNGDARDWREAGDDANIARINNWHFIIIDEEQLRADHYCSGKCDTFESYGTFGAMTSEYPNDCRGMLVRCWLHEETQKRKDAQEAYEYSSLADSFIGKLIRLPSLPLRPEMYENQFDHTGNKCKCLCNRLNDSNSNDNDERGKLIDSICLDPVSVDKDHVVTGVRFKIHDNVIYLELQQGKLINYRIVSKPEWKISYHCEEKKYINYSPGVPSNELFSILAEDFVLSEDAVVTGVTLGNSIRGRYINDNGNFDAKRDEFEIVSKYENMCGKDRKICIMNEFMNLRNWSQSDENPRVSTATNENYERSESCKTRIIFRPAFATINEFQNFVPYLDLQEVVTKPAEPIRGVGCFHTIIIDEEKLNFKHYCTGKCEILPISNLFSAMTFEYPNDCRGMLVRCWFHEETQKRKDAQSNYDNVYFEYLLKATCSRGPLNTKGVEKAEDRLDHTGNLCKCLCYRSFDKFSSVPNDKREKLTENLCLDPVSADKDHVVTGVRFKIYDYTIYLELQQAKLINNRIFTTPQWKTSHYCQNSRSLGRESFWGLKKSFNIIAEDLILPEDAVVTGVTLGESLRGRYINENGNFDKKRKEFTKATQCVTNCPDDSNELCKLSKRPSFRDTDSSDENPRVSTATKENYERIPFQNGDARDWREAGDDEIYENQLDHTGNKCKCLCNRLNDSNSNDNDERGKLIDSICLDPVSVDKDHVVTGVRFKIHDNVIYLELQQGKLINYRIVSKPEWKISYHCEEKKYIDYTPNLPTNELFSILAEDFVLSEDAVVTGVTLGNSIRGRYINDNGNFDAKRDEFEIVSKYENMCGKDRRICIMNEFMNLRNWSKGDENPRVSTATKENYERISTIVSLQRGDAREWREAGDDANLAKINSFHTIIIDEEKLNFEHYCTGKCETLTIYGQFGATRSEYPNDCRGMLVRCWLHEETQKRKDAQSNYDSVVYSDRLAASLTLSSSNIKIVKKAHDRLDHTGNLCKCLCYRIFDQDSSDPNDKREKLIENLCLDPVSADKDHVVTGVRFKRYDNTIYLELQQAKFINNRIVTTPQWKTSLYCQNSISLANESFWGLKENFNIIAEDLILPEDAVVTGVTLGQSLRGRYINENGNFDKNRKEFTKATQCVTK
ncbi:hypothetical protein KQX54_018013 [Cotesia glomerata]|uniref:Uncharacterized protein n=2 Tax=Cotesia glomerata TaxID=32391 RepID=A0AAV7HEZ2_COTGL|nr:hypothetical protein KQX54_018013 [Cotesia glomerata]